jgi:hypothetical protein
MVSTPGAALGDDKNLFTGLWLAIQNCAPELIHKNFPGVDHVQETRQIL